MTSSSTIRSVLTGSALNYTIYIEMFFIRDAVMRILALSRPLSLIKKSTQG